MWRFLLAVLVFLAAPAWGGGGINVAQPIQKGRLAIFPITGPAASAGEKYLTLDEGLEAGTVKVGELGSLSQSRILRGPSLPPQDVSRVNELALVNNSDRPLLLLAGEIVSGGKQDRVVARDRIVPPHSAPVPLGVFCVEPGRWRGLSMEFAAAKLMAAPEIRKQALVAQDQSKVWEEVARSRTAMAQTVTVESGAADAMPATSSYAGAAKASAVEHRVTEDANAFLPKLPDNALGMVVAVDGRLVWADLFPNAALFRRYRAKLLQSYVVESYRVTGSASQPPSLAEAQKFLREAGGRQNIEVEPDLYRLVRSESEGMVTYELEALGEGGVLRLHFARMVK